MNSAAAGDKSPVPQQSSSEISVDFEKVNIRTVLTLLAQMMGRNIVLSSDVQGSLTLKLKDVPIEQVFEIALRQGELKAIENKGVMMVFSLSESLGY